MSPYLTGRLLNLSRCFFLAYGVQIMYDGVLRNKKEWFCFSPLSEKTRIWQRVESFFVCDGIRVYCKDHNLCYWLRWAPSVSGARDVQDPCTLNSFTQGEHRRIYRHKCRLWRQLLKAKGGIENGMQCSLLTPFPAEETLWLKKNFMRYWVYFGFCSLVVWPPFIKVHLLYLLVIRLFFIDCFYGTLHRSGE